ncbi:MAG: hypothetical protein HY427_02935 [Candidatus Levybacteria bacterium]|nr:hypothetical protein [Candidatus Levybacteria bacterium]
MRYWKSWKYKNLTFLFVSLIFAFFLGRYEPFHNFLLNLGSYGYIGGFFAGIAFVSTLGVATGIVTLLVLAEKLNILLLGIIAGAGGVLGDFLLFRFVRDRLINEVKPIYDSLDHNHNLQKILHTKYFHWVFPVFGAIVIASPLPDEFGVTLMGISKMKSGTFLILSFILNASGIILVLLASRIIKP